MSQYAAWLISDILADRPSRFLGFGLAPVMVTPFASMFKTGTANQFQNIWALAATSRFTVGVWMGNFSGETVIGSTGSAVPATIAARLLAAMEASAGEPRGVDVYLAGPVPTGIAELRICSLSGMIAGPHCTGVVQEWVTVARIPSVCNWHTAAGLFYPIEYQAWLTERPRFGNIRQGETGRIRNPVSGSVFFLNPAIPPEAQALRLETAGFNPDALIYLNGQLQGSLNFAGVYTLPVSRGFHTVHVQDRDGRAATTSFEVR